MTGLGLSSWCGLQYFHCLWTTPPFVQLWLLCLVPARAAPVPAVASGLLARRYDRCGKTIIVSVQGEAV